MRSRCFSIAVVSLLVTSTTKARAYEAPLGPSDRVSVAASVGATATPRTTALAVQQLAPALATNIRIHRSWTIVAEWGSSTTAYRIAEQPRGVVTRSSNVLIGARWEYQHGPLHLVGGASVGAPLVTVPAGGITASAAAEQADRVALAASGPLGTWRWARNAVPAFASIRGSYTLGAARLMLDLQPGVLVSVNRNTSRAALVARGELAVAMGAVAPYFALSSVVSSAPLDQGDFAQSGAAAGVRYTLGRLFGWSEARLQLDGPEGLGQRYGTPWAATLGAGMAL